MTHTAETLNKMNADDIQKMIANKLSFSSHDMISKVYLFLQQINTPDYTKQKTEVTKWDIMDKNDVKVGIKVGVLQNGNMIDSGRIIEIEDGFVSMVDGDEGFGYEMDSVEFVELA